MRNTKTNRSPKGVLYIVTCGAPPAALIPDLIKAIRKDWQHICPIASLQATKFINAHLIEDLTGFPVRYDYKQPGEPDLFPKADVILAVPVTFNTMNKWALGIGDTLAASILCEHLGRGTPIIAVPWPNADLANHPSYKKNVSILIESGVKIIRERERQSSSETISWEEILLNLDEIHKSIK